MPPYSTRVYVERLLSSCATKQKRKVFLCLKPKKHADYALQKQLKLRRLTQKVVETNARSLIIRRDIFVGKVEDPVCGRR